MLTTNHQPLTTRAGISLLEVLISMFVLMIGLLGVASLLPVGQVQVVEGIKYDRAGAAGRAAFREISVRDLHDPEDWAYADGTQFFGDINGDSTQGTIIYGPNPSSSADDVDMPWLPACVIDPIGIGDGTPTVKPTMNMFPSAKSSAAMVVPATDLALPRLSYWWTYPAAASPAPPWKAAMTGPERWLMGDNLFRFTDDMLAERPKSGDLPATQTFSAGTNPRRQFTGDYTWLMTIVPETLKSETPSPPPGTLVPKLGRAPSQEWRDLWKVSVVVFYKRDMTGNVDTAVTPNVNYYTGERAYVVDFDRGLGVGTGLGLGGGEVVLRNVDEKDPLRSGQWIMLAGQYYDARDVTVVGVTATLGKLRRKYGWYRVASTTRPTKNANGTFDMAVSLVGPDWQANEANIPANNRPVRGVTPPLGTAGPVDANTQAWLFDGAIAVFEKTMRLDW